MSLDSVRAFLAEKSPDIAIIELETSTATVALAAEGHGVLPAQIAKTLSLRVGERNLLVVTRGDSRLDNRKAKAAFGGKPRMLSAEEVVALTGHPVGGVCPFGLATPMAVYCDVSLKAFDEVVRRQDRPTARYASTHGGWRNWSAPNGWMFVNESFFGSFLQKRTRGAFWKKRAKTPIPECSEPVHRMCPAKAPHPGPARPTPS